jgi:hypothetical protein
MSGFSIRCPYCQTLNKWEENPENKVVESITEFKNASITTSRKLLRCQNARWFCPASFEAFICKDKSVLRELSRHKQIKNSWSSNRQFRLYKEHYDKKDHVDYQNRWDKESEGKYFGILFNTQPVIRPQEIELELLIKPGLISHLIAGISVELGLPVTFFVAKRFYNNKSRNLETFWMPVEGYSQKPKLSPPLYNCFCETCRDIGLSKLVDEFDKAGCGSESNCFEKNGNDNMWDCGRRYGKPACDCNPDDKRRWVYCPAFVEKRKAEDPCYNSDYKLILEVVANFEKETPEYEAVSRNCYAGFIEMAFPIIIHGYLVGVAMTGQVFLDPSNLKNIEDFIKSKTVGGVAGNSWGTMAGKDTELRTSQQILIGLELLHKKDGKERYLLTDSQLEGKKEAFAFNIKQTEQVLELQYRDFRAKVELLFRQELLGVIENYGNRQDFFINDDGLSHVLRRMRKFWAFKGSFLVRYVCQSNESFLIAKSVSGGKGTSKINRKSLSVLIMKLENMHPTPYLYFKDVPSPVRHYFSDSHEIFEDIIKTGLDISAGDCILVILIPVYEEVYMFIFAVRDESNICSLPHRNPKSISVFCRDVVLETCRNVVHELYSILMAVQNFENWKTSYKEKVKSKTSDIARIIGDMEVHVWSGGGEEAGHIEPRAVANWIGEIQDKTNKINEIP